MVSFDPQTWTLTDNHGATHEIFEQELWYLAPATTVPNASTHPLQLAMTLHNAKRGHGIGIAPADLLAGLPFSTTKRGRAKEAEEVFEEVRLREFPYRPSRLRSHFLSLDEMSARERAGTWNLKIDSSSGAI